MVGADSAVVGATFHGFGSRIQYAFADSVVFIEAFVGFIIRPVSVFEVPVFGAVFGQYDLPVSFYYCGVESF